MKMRQIEGVCRALSGASICLRRPGFIKIPGLSRLSAGFTHYLEIRKTIKEKAIDAIVLYSVPTNGLQSIHLARKFSIPVVFRSIDIINILVPYPILRPLTKLLEKRVYSRVDMVLPNTPQYLKYIISMGVDESKVKLLPFPIDITFFRPSVDCSEVRSKWGFQESDQIIVFIGTLFHFSGLDVFIRQFPRILAEVPEARLLIVGDGPQRGKLEKIISEMGLETKVIITGFQPYTEMPCYINTATVCVNTFLNTRKTADFFPSKILQYVACGKATVATPLEGITSVIPGESGGVVYAEEEKMAEAVVRLLHDFGKRRQLGKAGMTYINNTHSCESIACQFEAEIKEVVEAKKRRAHARGG